jgi:hypothetical protein
VRTTLCSVKVRPGSRAARGAARWTIASRAVLDLSSRGRVVFAVAWLGLQGALVLTAGRRPDHAFGFRMFNESSMIEIHLTRRFRNGEERPLEIARWLERVREPTLSVLNRSVPARYGVDAQLSRLQAALDDFATHARADGETDAVIADVVVVKNGHAPQRLRLTSVTQ